MRLLLLGYVGDMVSEVQMAANVRCLVADGAIELVANHGVAVTAPTVGSGRPLLRRPELRT